MGGWARRGSKQRVSRLFGNKVPPCCPQTRSPCRAANFMQPSSCLWSRGRDRYYHQDGAEKRRKLSGNSVRWIKASGTYRHGSVFSCLHPLLSFILKKKVLLFSVCLSLLHVSCAERLGDLGVCGCDVARSADMDVCVISPRASWERFHLWRVFTHNARHSLRSFRFSARSFFRQIPVPFSAPAQNCLIGIKNQFSTLTLMM